MVRFSYSLWYVRRNATPFVWCLDQQEVLISKVKDQLYLFFFSYVPSNVVWGSKRSFVGSIKMCGAVKVFCKAVRKVSFWATRYVVWTEKCRVEQCGAICPLCWISVAWTKAMRMLYDAEVV